MNTPRKIQKKALLNQNTFEHPKKIKEIREQSSTLEFSSVSLCFFKLCSRSQQIFTHRSEMHMGCTLVVEGQDLSDDTTCGRIEVFTSKDSCVCSIHSVVLLTAGPIHCLLKYRGYKKYFSLVQH